MNNKEKRHKLAKKTRLIARVLLLLVLIVCIISLISNFSFFTLVTFIACFMSGYTFGSNHAMDIYDSWLDEEEKKENV